MTSKDSPRHYPMPFTRVEVVVLTINEGAMSVLQGRRSESPYAGYWALPGGVLRIDLDKTLEDAPRRVIAERLGVELPYLRQIGAVGGANRDPRAPWGLSVVYRALVPYESVIPKAGKRLEALRWSDANEATQDTKLAFDHSELISQAVSALRREVEELALPFKFLPAEFTLSELQGFCEVILGKTLDKSSFRRRLADRKLVKPVSGRMRIGANRPAQLYQRVKS